MPPSCSPVRAVRRRRPPVATYSGGMRRRLNLAAGLVGRPEAVFLDEPTISTKWKTIGV